MSMDCRFIFGRLNGDDAQDGYRALEFSSVGRVYGTGREYALGSRRPEHRKYRTRSCSVSMLLARLSSLWVPIQNAGQEARVELRRHLLEFCYATMDLGDAAGI